jgi:hypothetical protein
MNAMKSKFGAKKSRARAEQVNKKIHHMFSYLHKNRENRKSPFDSLSYKTIYIQKDIWMNYNVVSIG